jgi:RNA polymerase sigma factor (TIGR02999 family)
MLELAGVFAQKIARPRREDCINYYTLPITMVSSPEAWRLVDTTNITALLRRASAGDREAEEELLPRIYTELKRLAASYLRKERPGHTLQATALVHEAYIKLTDHAEMDWQGRNHFFALAAHTMRHVLTDHARTRNAVKRGGACAKISLNEQLLVTEEECSMLTNLDEALEDLSEIEPRQARIVEMRYFGGLSEEEIGEMLGLSSRTVKRDWKKARAWLLGRLS